MTFAGLSLAQFFRNLSSAERTAFFSGSLNIASFGLLPIAAGSAILLSASLERVSPGSDRNSLSATRTAFSDGSLSIDLCWLSLNAAGKVAALHAPFEPSLRARLLSWSRTFVGPEFSPNVQAELGRSPVFVVGEFMTFCSLAFSAVALAAPKTGAVNILTMLASVEDMEFTTTSSEKVASLSTCAVRYLYKPLNR